MTASRGNPGYKGRLLDSSIETYILALEIINRLSMKYRIETFCYLMCKAWELLLKAKIIHDAGSPKAVFYKPKRNQPRTSLTLDHCLGRVFSNSQDPLRRNIEYIAELRNEGTHLVISQVPKDIMGLFQASVLNYHNSLVQWFSVSLSDRFPVGMMTIVFDTAPSHHES